MKNERILLAHGSGGRLMHELIKKTFLKKFSNPFLEKLNDSAILENPKSKLAFTTDNYVVNPLFFNGGDIGKLAIAGTVNDLAMSGATPKYITVAFVIEEGFFISELERILNSMAKAAREADIQIVAGDTKVVERGGADKLFINTTGIGFISPGINISAERAKVGDKIIVSGSIGDHGIAIMTEREGLKFKTKLKSDCAPLNQLVREMLTASKQIRTLRDPTRGGLATSLNELAQVSRKAFLIEEKKVPIKKEVMGACEMLGFDPFHVANEGKLIAIVAKESARKIIEVMRKNKYGKDAEIIGEVKKEPQGKVLLKTLIGTTRILDMLTGEQLPRIC